MSSNETTVFEAKQSINSIHELLVEFFCHDIYTEQKS